MPTYTRTFAATLTLVSLLTGLSALPSAVTAAGETRLELMPHCTETDRTKCPAFAVLDAERLTTSRLKAGDLLDIDVVLKTADPSLVSEVRSWLSYDPKILESRSVELTNAVTSPTPGEQEADQKNGLIKLGGAVNGLTSSDTAIARVTFRVIAATANTTVAFHQYLPTGGGYTAVNGEGHTAAGAEGVNISLRPAPCVDPLIGCDETARTPLLSVRPANLFVSLTDATSVASSSAVSSSLQATPIYGRASSASSVSSGPFPGMEGATNTSSSASARFDTAPSPFSLLQVQGLQVTTRDTTVYLGWQTLKSTELGGYNIYYGTVSGRYIQRRSVPPTAISTVLRDFEPDTTYYLAIRGFNLKNEETMFSREVSVTVGKPETATVPFMGSGLPGAENVVTNNGGSSVSGETGTGTSVAVVLMLSAFIGTAFAVRRQFSLTHVS